MGRSTAWPTSTRGTGGAVGAEVARRVLDLHVDHQVAARVEGGGEGSLGSSDGGFALARELRPVAGVEQRHQRSQWAGESLHAATIA